MSEILETVMIISFGMSWPLNVLKSYRARTAKGKSLAFLILLLFGYACGITSKFINPDFMANFNTKWYIVFFYCLNFVMISADLFMYFRNRKLDKEREGK